MTSTTTIKKEASLSNILNVIRRLSPPEQETLEALLDKEFSKILIKRGREIGRLRRQNRLLSLQELQHTFRA